MVTGPELSPPSPGGATYGRPPEQPSPSVLHTTFTNNACAFDYSSSNASSPEPSPLRLPMKSLAARAQQLAASRLPPGPAPPGGPTAFEHASPGHLILRMPSSQAGEVEASQGSKQHRLSCSSLPHQEELAPEGSESPRIAARHSWHQGAPCWQPAAQGRRASAASDAGSFIEWSLSSMSVAFPAEPAGPLEAGSSAAPLPAGNASLSRLSYSAACVAGSSDGDGDSLGDDLLGCIFVSGGHLIARAAPRFLWSPSSSPEGAAGAAAASDFSADSSPGGGNAAAGAALLGSLQTAELAGTAPAAAPPPAASHYHSPGGARAPLRLLALWCFQCRLLLKAAMQLAYLCLHAVGALTMCRGYWGRQGSFWHVAPGSGLAPLGAQRSAAPHLCSPGGGRCPCSGSTAIAGPHRGGIRVAFSSRCAQCHEPRCRAIPTSCWGDCCLTHGPGPCRARPATLPAAAAAGAEQQPCAAALLLAPPLPQHGARMGPRGGRRADGEPGRGAASA